jgi:hypothetical protein
MKIFDEQLENLDRSQAELFEERVMQFIVTRFAGGAEREVSRGEVRALITEAHEAGLETEREVTAYVVGAWLYGETFLAMIEPLRDDILHRRVAPSTVAGWLFEVLDRLER